MTLRFISFPVFILLFLMGSSILAQEEAPAESPLDNACYAGGPWEGKCEWPTQHETLWAWTCGWYIARAQTGRIADGAVPMTCGYNAQDLSEQITWPQECFASAGMSDMQLVAPLNRYRNIQHYNSKDGSCSGGIFIDTYIDTFIITVAGTPDLKEISEACDAVYAGSEAFSFLGVIGPHLATTGYNTPDDWYLCLV